MEWQMDRNFLGGWKLVFCGNILILNKCTMLTIVYYRIWLFKISLLKGRRSSAGTSSLLSTSKVGHCPGLSVPVARSVLVYLSLNFSKLCKNDLNEISSGVCLTQNYKTGFRLSNPIDNIKIYFPQNDVLCKSVNYV